MGTRADQIVNTSVIYQDFADAINRENHVIHHGRMTHFRAQSHGWLSKAPSLGRAYLTKDPELTLNGPCLHENRDLNAENIDMA